MTSTKHFSPFAVSLCLLSPVAWAAATNNTQVVNADGSVTITQTVDESSSAPHYVSPGAYGFGIYSNANQDYGWQHTIAIPDGAQILEAKLTIYAYDVDSEAFRGENGEYDGVSVGGVQLNPGFLQGTNNTWSITEFALPIASLNDGLVNVFLDIDMNNGGWLTTLDYSLMTVTYLVTSNTPPSVPELSRSQGLSTNDDLVVSIIGPTPADPDGDSVSYNYRWFVDVGQGFFVDDEFAGKNNHTGASVSASQTNNGERWKVQVQAEDANGLISDITEIEWPAIGDSDGDGVADEYDYAPNDSTIAFQFRTPTTGWYTLAYEDMWPFFGDYDLNDFVSHYAYVVYTNSLNQITRIDFIGQAVARGAALDNSFALSVDGIEAKDVKSLTRVIDGKISNVVLESGHSGELVFVVLKSISTLLPADSNSNFYNTELGDNRPVVDYSVSLVLNGSMPPLAGHTLNPFIFRAAQRGREVHLMNYPNSDLANQGSFGQGADATNAQAGEYYLTADGLPWAISIPAAWKHPYENIDCILAYPEIANWAESGGLKYTAWFNNWIKGKCWKCN
ncbi:LruC domain-containing protein [Vibrio vulnificus]|uniref:LruC domain-containing protein n=1 Tax=Vibrio vulnificus TaxID=672 RepID=UPI001029711A|nr:LruC domain-containing protein [Vibrio vulnificus]EGQ7966194.1 LruC domain-containing protein [Vibrio vulnificus]RZR25578.1 LruC domain-containing protein [Vibrio vulnificus]HAS8488322.1 LruC domain-containing protein [Vibrio vulnificus]